MTVVPTGDSQFIVAEVSKNWINGQGVSDDEPISVKFEAVITVNRARGYRLLDFSLHRMRVRPDEMNEMIIAVFERGSEPSVTVSPIHAGEEGDGPLLSTDVFLEGRGITLLVNVRAGDQCTYALSVDGVSTKHGTAGL